MPQGMIWPGRVACHEQSGASLQNPAHWRTREINNYYFYCIIFLLLEQGAAVEEAEVRKHKTNDPKCSELGWVCIPLAVETYGNWGREAQSTFSRLASHLAIITSSHKGKVLTELYSRLNFTLVRAVTRALLARCALALGLQDIIEFFYAMCFPLMYVLL